MRRLGRRFLRREEGAAAIEFAIVVAPFLALVFAIMETAIVFFAGQTLETAVADSARLIMTGQAQNKSPAMTKEEFQQEVCKRLYAMFKCTAGSPDFAVNVQTYTAFSSVTYGNPLDPATGNFKPTAYTPGAAGEIVVVRVMYRWPIFGDLLGLGLSNINAGTTSTNKRLLTATAAFRNEPF